MGFPGVVAVPLSACLATLCCAMPCHAEPLVKSMHGLGT